MERALPTGPVGPFQLQAAIAAVHAEGRAAYAVAARLATSIPEQRYAKAAPREDTVAPR